MCVQKALTNVSCYYYYSSFAAVIVAAAKLLILTPFLMPRTPSPRSVGMFGIYGSLPCLFCHLVLILPTLFLSLYHNSDIQYSHGQLFKQLYRLVFTFLDFQFCIKSLKTSQSLTSLSSACRASRNASVVSTAVTLRARTLSCCSACKQLRGFNYHV